MRCAAGDLLGKRIWPKALLFGMAASFLLALSYILILTWLNSFAHAVQRFFEIGLWMPAIIIGFGLQIFLFVYMRESARQKNILETGSVAVSGSASASSMALCCLHHVSDVIPIIGISAATIFISRFEGFFFSLAVVSNTLGSVFLLGKIQEHSLFPKDNKLISRFFRLSMANSFALVAVLGTLALAISLADSIYL